MIDSCRGRIRHARNPSAVVMMVIKGVASKAPSTVEVLEEVQPGDGKRFPKTGDKVVVHYTGSLRSAAPEAPGCSSDHRVRGWIVQDVQDNAKFV